jgi:hypothetical protein
MRGLAPHPGWPLSSELGRSRSKQKFSFSIKLPGSRSLLLACPEGSPSSISISSYFSAINYTFYKQQRKFK